MPAVLKLQLNTAGTDYVVGDIHGAFDELISALNLVSFNPEVDRLFLVGDLVDRGNFSVACRELLKKPWVYAVQGNHERIFLELFEHDHPDKDAWAFHAENNGLGWTYQLSAEDRAEICSLFKRLPYAIEFPTTRGSVGIVHAEVPPGMSWPQFLEALEAGSSRAIEQATWGRVRIKAGYSAGVQGIDRLFCGHTIQSGIKRLGNAYYIDTAAFLKNFGRTDGHLSLINVVAATQVVLAPKPSAARQDIKLTPGIGPFGNYSQ